MRAACAVRLNDILNQFDRFGVKQEAKKAEIVGKWVATWSACYFSVVLKDVPIDVVALSSEQQLRRATAPNSPNEPTRKQHLLLESAILLRPPIRRRRQQLVQQQLSPQAELQSDRFPPKQLVWLNFHPIALQPAHRVRLQPLTRPVPQQSKSELHGRNYAPLPPRIPLWRRSRPSQSPCTSTQYSH